MGDFSNFFKSLFDNQKTKKSNIPFLHEPIDLSSFPTDEAEKWKSEGGFDEFAELVDTAYRDHFILSKAQLKRQAVTFLDSSHTNGWFLECGKLNYLDSSYKYFANSLSVRIKDLGYVIQIAESKSISVTEGVKMITHYYLKPSLKNRTYSNQGLISQLYGNISIEYIAINGNPKSFKFLLKAYNDSKYMYPLDFSELHKHMFGD